VLLCLEGTERVPAGWGSWRGRRGPGCSRLPGSCGAGTLLSAAGQRGIQAAASCAQSKIVFVFLQGCFGEVS